MRRGREKKVMGQMKRDKRGDHGRQADEDNGRDVQGNIPKRRGVRTAQTGLRRVFWVLCPGLPSLGGQKKRNF